jgi:SAM-dependent methyltransferase
MKSLLKSILSQTGMLQPIKRLLKRGYMVYPIDQFITIGETAIDHVAVTSYSDYKKYISEYAQRIHDRLQIERQITKAHGQSYFITGNNFLTGNPSNEYLVDIHHGSSNLRESCVCQTTGLNSRVRASLFAIQQSFDNARLAASDVYLTEAVTDLFNWCKGKSNTLTGSEYLGNDIPGGTIKNGVMHQDVTALSFPDNSFDLSICMEVMEHVPAYHNGFREMCRVTKPGGSVFITVPFLEQQEQTVIRASLAADGSITHHLEPEYHGDPVNKTGGVLCFQHFGWDMVDALREAGFKTVRAHFIWSARNLILGEHIIVFEAVK